MLVFHSGQIISNELDEPTHMITEEAFQPIYSEHFFSNTRFTAQKLDKLWLHSIYMQDSQRITLDDIKSGW